MRVYFAPMEGLTDSVYRRLHQRFFPGLSRYYIPFYSPAIHRTLSSREKRELSPSGSAVCETVPQILTKSPEDFLWAAQICAELGYREVNLNAGCPSGTVTAKGKGAGLLADPAALDGFLGKVCEKSPLPVSVKTRLGLESAAEFTNLLEVYNRHPLAELIVHPRVRRQFYAGHVDMDAFRFAATQSRNPICYSGNLCTLAQINAFAEEFPRAAVMVGRGLIGNPGMFSPGTTAQTLRAFHDALLEEYFAVLGGSRNVMFRMKEIWSYHICLFEGSEKLGRQLRKTTDIGEYRAITAEIFETLPLRKDLKASW